MNNETEIGIKLLNSWGKTKTPFVFLIDFECKKPRYWKLNEPIEDFKFKFPGFTNVETENSNIHNKELTFYKQPITFEQYNEKFEKVKKEIEYGNSFLVNLTVETPIKINYSLAEVFNSIQTKYACWLKNEFVCFSPESFVCIKKGKIYGYPMKGTIDAKLPNAKQILINDTKELAEHATIVDLIRNDLSKVAYNVKVTNFRFYEEIKTQHTILGQISSEIEGQLPSNFNEYIGDIIFKLLPAGSVSGAPKERTKKIIFDAEQVERGYYTGVAGYFDGENMDSCVLIRYLQENAIYRSGGGITFQSDALKEYQEIVDKVYVPIF